MKKLLLVIMIVSGFLFAQNSPIDFETGGYGATWTWTVFENDNNPSLEIVTNPNTGDLNSSATVAMFTALQSGQPWAGCESLHGADIGSFSFDSTNCIIKIMVWKDVISDVGIKFVDATSAAQPEIKVANTLINQWEELTFDFSSRIGVYPVVKDQIVIFPDFDLTGRTQDNICYFDNISFSPSNSVGVDNRSETLPQGFALEQNFPNPFNPFTTLRYDLPEDSFVNITIYDMMGRQVKTLINGLQTPGYKTVQWDATNDKNRPVSAGLYLYTIQAGEFRQVRKMVLLKQNYLLQLQAPHSWGFLFVGGWVDLVMIKRIIALVLFIGLAFLGCENNSHIADQTDEPADIIEKSSKRGLAFNLTHPDDFESLKEGVAWWYNWHWNTAAPENYYQDYQMEFIPMLWGGNTSDSDIENVKFFIINHPEVKYLLVMNEPNLTDQANRTPSQAAIDWLYYEQAISDL